MKEFIRNNKFTLIGFGIGIIWGILLYQNNRQLICYRAVFEYQITKSTTISEALKKDTFFIYNSTPTRVYFNSIADSLKMKGIKRSELIIYLPNELNLEHLNKNILQPLSNNNASFIYYRNEGMKDYSRRYIYIPLTWLLIGYLMNLLYDRLRPKKNAITTPI